MGASSTPFDRFDKLTAGKLRTSRSRKINHPTPSGGMIFDVDFGFKKGLEMIRFGY